MIITSIFIVILVYTDAIRVPIAPKRVKYTELFDYQNITTFDNRLEFGGCVWESLRIGTHVYGELHSGTICKIPIDYA